MPARPRRATLAAACLVLATLGFTSMPALAQTTSTSAVTQTQTPTITVTGQATAVLTETPSQLSSQMLNLNFNLQVQAPTAATALAQAQSKLSKLESALSTLPSAEITNQNWNVNPRYKCANSQNCYNPGGKITGFTAQANVNLTATATSMGKAIAIAAKLGITGFNSYQNGANGPTRVPAAVVSSAIPSAYRSAAEEARALAKAMGVTLGPIVTARVEPPQPNYGNGPSRVIISVTLTYRIG